jgi:SAM-dependent methyltransferase
MSRMEPDPFAPVSIPEANYDETAYGTTHNDRFRLVASLVTERAPTRILDIGVGAGLFYRDLPDRARYDLHGVDIVPAFLPVLTARGITGAIADINTERLPYEDASFDMILCDSLLEHTLNPRHVIDEIARVLMPGGMLILVTPNALSARQRFDYLRGRNQFWPLIHNLMTVPYLRRCSVFYALPEIEFILKDRFTISSVSYLDESAYDRKTLSTIVRRVLSRLVPSLRDVIIVSAQRSV